MNPLQQQLEAGRQMRVDVQDSVGLRRPDHGAAVVINPPAAALLQPLRLCQQREGVCQFGCSQLAQSRLHRAALITVIAAA